MQLYEHLKMLRLWKVPTSLTTMEQQEGPLATNTKRGKGWQKAGRAKAAGPPREFGYISDEDPPGTVSSNSDTASPSEGDSEDYDSDWEDLFSADALSHSISPPPVVQNAESPEATTHHLHIPQPKAQRRSLNPVASTPLPVPSVPPSERSALKRKQVADSSLPARKRLR
jgi:hypothetical protein